MLPVGGMGMTAGGVHGLARTDRCVLLCGCGRLEPACFTIDKADTMDIGTTTTTAEPAPFTH